MSLPREEQSASWFLVPSAWRAKRTINRGCQCDPQRKPGALRVLAGGPVGLRHRARSPKPGLRTAPACRHTFELERTTAPAAPKAGPLRPAGRPRCRTRARSSPPSWWAWSWPSAAASWRAGCACRHSSDILLAGVAVGPFTPGFVADIDLAGQLAEIGVILLMFGIGLHFSIKDLLAVDAIALPGALAQIAVPLAACAALALLWGWAGRRPPPRPRSVRREHGRAAAGSGRARGARPRRGPDRDRLADRPGRRDGAGAGVAAGARRLGRGRSVRAAARMVGDGVGFSARAHAGQGRRLRRPGRSWSGRASCHGSSSRWPVPARASCSRCRCWRQRWGSPMARRSCSGSPSRSARSSPAWC